MSSFATIFKAGINLNVDFPPLNMGVKGVANEDTLLLMIVSMLRKPGNICCRHKMFLKEIRNIFVSRTQILCPQQMLPARANGETFVSATMCPQHCVLVCHHLNRNISFTFKQSKNSMLIPLLYVWGVL